MLEEEGQKPGRRGNGWLINGMILGGILLMVSALAGILLLNRPSFQAGQNGVVPARIGVKMADFSLVDLHGKRVRLSDYEGQAVLINVWATWCPPCLAEMPALNAFYQQHREDGFVILAINAGEPHELAARFANQLGLLFPILLDTDEALVDALGIRDYPTSILVGRDGMVKAIHIGMYTPDALERELLPLIR